MMLEVVASKLAGRFAIGRTLGVGGKGVVYAARDGGEEIALKLLREELVASEKTRHQFFREADAMARVSHPSLVRVLEAGQLPDGRPYLCMPLLSGETLADRLKRGALDLEVALTLFEKLASAASAIHGAGLVHRDIKPENILMVGETEPVLLDLGLAREVGSALTTTGVVTGTRAYMAPERFFGRPATVASDVYELALVLYLTLTGVLPWADDSDPQARLNPRPLDAVLAPSPRVSIVSAAVTRALSPRPEARFASARALLDAVQRAPGPAGNVDASRTRVTEDLPVLSGSTPMPDPQVEPAATPAPRASFARRGVVGVAAIASAAALVTFVRAASREDDGASRTSPLATVSAVADVAAPSPASPPRVTASVADPVETALPPRPSDELRPAAPPSRRPRIRPRVGPIPSSRPAPIDDRAMYEHR